MVELGVDEPIDTVWLLVYVPEGTEIAGVDAGELDATLMLSWTAPLTCCPQHLTWST